ncbi:GAF domain-containing sensor histidine kinase [Leptolyngbya sp. FACHB-17]|uniref:GAF domain-containing sensor histidine kinase n=1 Tax=unclassified Leptolyngbya TaxID=2650499 RepID=UPI00167FE4E0|nr:GAF domain-containing sensor histidine kinase [Leptolyngbya sp. FACHB-17]MBD2081448.1 GAF domain-containing sensor histidine kinase [Leptolyngbya sp. FACHB-17]
MPTSSEFIELCRSQIALLTQALGASLSVIYLTEELVESSQARLMPIAAYPEAAGTLDTTQRLALPAAVESYPEVTTSSGLTQPKQLVLPLIHEELVFGLLVTEREDRPWTTWERSQVERIANTLSLACVMDQRAQWLDQAQRQHRSRQSQQHDVLDNLLHQLKSPLTALRTFGKLLVKRMQATDANREIAGSILRESDRLQELLQQFDEAIDLDSVDVLAEDASLVSRPIPLLPAGVLTTSSLELMPCSVNEILLLLVETAGAIAQEKGLALRTEVPNPLPLVSANPGALREVLSNLIDNALKYTPLGGEVHIRANHRDDYVNVWVSDTGYGIPPQDLERLFERHYRGVQADGDIPGTGLGLAIARRLIEQMHGSIQVFSPLKSEGWIAQDDHPPQRGTSFVVKLLKNEVEETLTGKG